MIETGTVDEALAAIEDQVPDLILCDWRMPGRDGGELLDDIRERSLGCAFIIMTAYGSIAHAVDAIQRGADDYLGKPFEREAFFWRSAACFEPAASNRKTGSCGRSSERAISMVS